MYSTLPVVFLRLLPQLGLKGTLYASPTVLTKLEGKYVRLAR